MKKILTFVIVLNSFLFASNNESNDSERDQRIKRQIQIEMEKEKKYSKEQTFYQNRHYDFKGAEVNEESLSSLPEVEVDELDMDSVYD